MKSFDDFRASLAEDDIANIANHAQNALDNARDDFSKNPKTNLGNQIIPPFIAPHTSFSLKKYQFFLH